MDRLMLANWAGLETLGVYSVALRLSFPFAMLTTTAGGLIFSHESAMFTSASRSSWQRFPASTERLLALGVAPLVILFGMLLSPLVTIVLGPTYALVEPIAVLLAIAGAVQLMQQPYRHMTAAAGLPRVQMHGTVVGVCIQLLLLFLFVRYTSIEPGVGISPGVAAAVALVVSSVVQLAIHKILARRSVGAEAAPGSFLIVMVLGLVLVGVLTLAERLSLNGVGIRLLLSMAASAVFFLILAPLGQATRQDITYLYRALLTAWVSVLFRRDLGAKQS
jgi:O-antigen/teichoic acid export membrane protein